MPARRRRSAGGCVYSPQSFNRAAGIPSGPVPVVSYARISVAKKKAKNGKFRPFEMGVSNQHRENRAVAARFGCEVVCEITDNNKSASKDQYREGFEDLIWSLAHGGKCRQPGHDHTFQGVIVVEQSRLARKFYQWERFTDTLTDVPERVYIQGTSMLDPYGEGFEMMGALEMVGNKREPKKTSIRVTRDHMHRAIAGAPVPGRRLFGYMADGKRKNPKEAPIAAEMIERAAKGHSITSITRWLQDQGARTTVGGVWRVSAVRTWLRNPKPSGLRRMNRTGWIVLDPDTGEEKIGDWQTYCTPEVWKKINARMEESKGRKWDIKNDQPGALIDPSSYGTIGKGRKYLLSGFVRCGKPTAPDKPGGPRCNTQLTTGPHPTQKDRWQYRCPPKAQGGCNGIGRDRDRVDAYVVETIMQELERVRGTEPTVPVEEWSGGPELDAALAARAALMTAWSDGRNPDISPDLFYASLLPGAERRVREAQLDRDRWYASQVRQVGIPADPRGEWEAQADLQWRQDWLSDHIVAVIVKPASRGTKFCPDDIEIVWRDR
ncbi:recombinase family protein [Actinoplanes sp. NPDC049802]|uniref:recombinase family protein n=1 Tax=Actinoplanes sp. NPDC049802 TaxID=3154742 RepID=UPI0033FB3A04